MKTRFRAAWFLQHCIDIDGAAGENCGEAGDDAGLVSHEESQVVLGCVIGTDTMCVESGRFEILGALTRPSLFRVCDCQNVGDDRDGCGMSAGTVAAKDLFAAVNAGGYDESLAALRARQGG